MNSFAFVDNRHHPFLAFDLFVHVLSFVSLFHFFQLFLSFFPFEMNFDHPNKKRTIESSSSSSSSASLIPCPSSLVLLAHSFGFLSLAELSLAGSLNHEWQQAAPQAWNNKKELQLTGDLLEKGLDAVLIHNHCAHRSLLSKSSMVTKELWS